MNASPASSPAPSAHYENFPVASLLCPPALRPPIAAIYWFARTADDIADEGDAPAAQRLADLAAYRADLQAVVAGRPHSGRWAPVFDALAPQLRAHALPPDLLDALLRAFEQDVVYTAEGRRHPDRDSLLDYCTRSANPVGRLLLHLYGVRDAQALAESDAVCSALQLINFWQDLSVDVPRGRHYLPGPRDGDVAVLRREIEFAQALMARGAPLVHRVSGRAGWELRLVVQGGLAVLAKVRALDAEVFRTRPRLRALDVPGLLWRALWM